MREITENDISLLLSIYTSTRAEEIDKYTDWDSEKKQQFYWMQFSAQHNYYQQNYKTASFGIISKDKEPIGRLYLDKNFEKNHWRIIDITILPKWRNQGIGKGIIEDILTQTEKVTIHVEAFNPAMKLYERLGFKKVSEANGVYFLFEWKAKQ
jgi:ribosomal protein S18 acetylase RimI-like enzyme